MYRNARRAHHLAVIGRRQAPQRAPLVGFVAHLTLHVHARHRGGARSRKIVCGNAEREGALSAVAARLATVLDVERWESWQRQTGDGAVESQQGVVLGGPVVEFSCAGAERLGDAYWREVARVTRGLVRPRARNGALELRLFGHGPALLRFGPPTLQATDTLVRCSYPIEGGLLARRPAGEIAFAQVGGSSPTVRSTIRGFFPSLAARQGERDWTGALYSHVQSRVHVAISRRYFARLINEARG